MFAVSTTTTFDRLFLEPRIYTSIALRRSAKDSFVLIQFLTTNIGRSRFSDICKDSTDNNFSVSLLDPPLGVIINGVNELVIHVDCLLVSSLFR